MDDIINNILEYNVVLTTDNFIKNYNELDIVKSFVHKLSTIKVTVQSLMRHIPDNGDMGGMFDNYETKIYLSSMKLIIQFDDDEAVKALEMKIRKLDNIYLDTNVNIINTFSTIEKIIKHCINHNMLLRMYKPFIRTIIYIITCNINDKFYSKNNIKYKIGLD
jgi:hypothetical protein